MIIDREIMHNRIAIIVVVTFPYIFISFSEVLKAYSLNSYIVLFSEDGVIEYLQATLLAISSLTACLIGSRFKLTEHRYLAWTYFLGALLLFFFCMEEISWGQRIFGFETTEYFTQYNHQNEINLHNHDFFQNQDNTNTWFTMFLGFGIIYCGSAWFLVPRLFEKKIGHIIHYVVPNCYLASYFLFSLFWQLYPACRQLTEPYLNQGQEVSEFLMFVGILLFIAFGFIRQSVKRHAP